MPEHILPMTARLALGPADEDSAWSFEVKWDGVRAIAYAQPGRLRLESRNLNDITDAYPEVRGLIEDLGMREAVLDGEIVAFDERPGGRASSASSGGCMSRRRRRSAGSCPATRLCTRSSICCTSTATR